MTTARDLLSVAASQIGVKENPANSNKVKYAEWYGMNGQPWCDMFVSWCAYQAGAQNAVGKFAYCPYHADFFKKAGRWINREDKPQPGDIVFFANKKTACHVGIVETRNGSSSVTTIEGNTAVGDDANGGQVMRRTRPYGAIGSSWYIMGFGRPAYDGISTSQTEEKQADMTPDTTVEVQMYLNKAYGASLAADGIFGLKTRASIVTQVQRSIGTIADGIFGPNSKAAWGSKVLRNGSRGNLAKLSQMMLVCRNYDVGPCGCDGEIGVDTTSGIRSFQYSNKLAIDGELGRETAAELFG